MTIADDPIKCGTCGANVVYGGTGEDEYGPYTATICPVCSPGAVPKPVESTRED